MDDDVFSLSMDIIASALISSSSNYYEHYYYIIIINTISPQVLFLFLLND